MRIAVIGCGVGGLAAALALRRRGHSITLFERWPDPRPVGAGLLLQPTGLAALDALGLGSRLRDWGAPVERLYGRTVRGKTVLDLRYRRTPGLGVHRGALFNALYGAVRLDDPVIESGDAIVDIEPADGRGPLTVIAASGARHGPFALAVIADGSGSALRRKLRPGVRAPIYPWGALWAIRPDPGGVWSGVLSQVYDDARIMMGVLPVGQAPSAWGAQRSISFFWSMRREDFTRVEERGLDHLRRRMVAFWPDIEPLLAGMTDMREFAQASYQDVTVHRPSKGRIVFIGDAAHGMSPQLGQGANLALIDALTLAHHVGDVSRGRPAPIGLARYVRARAGHVVYYRWASRALTPLFQSNARWIARLRDALMPLGGRLPFIAGWMHATLTGRARLGLTAWRGPWERRR